MNQDNNNFELSGTLGSLKDAALNNLANQNTTETAEPVLNNTNNTLNTVSLPESGEIEMLDISAPQTPVTPATPIVSEAVTSNNVEVEESSTQDSNSEMNLNIPPLMDINTSIPNFDMGEIGSVPPVDPTGKGEKKKKKKPVLFIILLIIIILAVGGLVYYYLSVSKGSIASAVETKNLSLELGEELSTDINDYATFNSIASSNCVLDTDSVDPKKPGEYEYTISCGNNKYTGKITLKDSATPIVVTKTIVKKINETVTAEEFIEKCDDSSNCSYTFENEEQVNNSILQAGTYDFNINVTDESNNKVTVPVKLIVIESDIKAYLNCTLAEQTVEGFNGTVSYIDRIGINTELKYMNLYFRIVEYIPATEEDYNTIKTSYTESGILNINNGNGKPVFDDTKYTITIEDTLSGAAEFGTDFSAIKTYYTNKSYQCNIMGVN